MKTVASARVQCTDAVWTNELGRPLKQGELERALKLVTEDVRHIWDVIGGFMEAAGVHTSVILAGGSNAEDFTKFIGSVQGLLRCTGALLDAVQRVVQPGKLRPLAGF
jgi:hypothetical protein